ncbi:MAG: calcium-binding protein [Dehalococcoidia bacterium]|nr:calcium-binding protein [Dehalococcoidia bacterium]
MSKTEKDQEREERIAMEAIVDAYGPEEQAMGWYYYLADKINFPFKARCVKTRHTSPLKVGEEINVVRMAAEDDCSHEMFVEIRWSGKRLAIPLAQIEPIETDDETQEAIEDWHYWMAQGYELG